MNRKLYMSIACLITVTIFSTDACALDSKRKGFILGFSVGPSITSFNQKTVSPFNNDMESGRENKLGAGTDFRIGYALSNKTMVYYTLRSTMLRISRGDEDVTILNSLNSLGISYYMVSEAPSLYVAATVGMSSWGTIRDQLGWLETGFGLGGTIGYEFRQYWSIEGTVMWSNPGDSNIDIDYSNVIGGMITVAGTWY